MISNYQQKRIAGKKIYSTGPLFNTKECVFNLEITARLEEAGFSVFLPQRDGFEFAELYSQLQMQGLELSKAVSIIIYLRDLHIIQDADICLANLEEPLDPGVIVEITYAKAWGIPVIGYRCESKTPFGMAGDWNTGMHFFPLFQCDHFINFTNQALNTMEEQKQIFDDIAKQILKYVELYSKEQFSHKINICDQKWQKDDIGQERPIQATQKLLIMTYDYFGAHIPTEKLAQNYLKIKDQLQHLLPNVIKFDENQYINVCQKEGIQRFNEKNKVEEFLNVEEQHNKM